MPKTKTKPPIAHPPGNGKGKGRGPLAGLDRRKKMLAGGVAAAVLLALLVKLRGGAGDTAGSTGADPLATSAGNLPAWSDGSGALQPPDTLPPDYVPPADDGIPPNGIFYTYPVPVPIPDWGDQGTVAQRQERFVAAGSSRLGLHTGNGSVPSPSTKPPTGTKPKTVPKPPPKEGRVHPPPRRYVNPLQGRAPFVGKTVYTNALRSIDSGVHVSPILLTK